MDQRFLGTSETAAFAPGEVVAIDSVSLDPANARRHPERNLDVIKASLRRFGQQKPIVVDADGIVRAGNGTLATAKALGWTLIAIYRMHLRGSEATAFALADNRAGELAEWDADILGEQIEALELEGFEGLDDLGLGDVWAPDAFAEVPEVDPPELRGGDRAPFQQMTFTLHDEQVESVKAAVEKAKGIGVFVGPNANSNGNAIARIAEAYLGSG